MGHERERFSNVHVCHTNGKNASHAVQPECVCVCDSSVLSMDKSASVCVFQFESAVDGAVPVPSLQTSGSKLIGTATL